MSTFVSQQQRNDISNWFRSVCGVKVGDVTREFPGVLALDYNTPVSEALSILEELHIQSVAVTASPNAFIGAGGVDIVSGDKQYIGIASILDVLAFSLKNESDFLSHRLCDVIGSTSESLSLWCEDVHQPLYFALEQFVKGVHHALVRDSKDSSAPLKYLSQTDILRFLLAYTEALPHLELVLVQPVQIVTTWSVVPVFLNTPLTEAIAVLVRHSAVPVVNEAGIVVSNLSASDFKGKSTTDLRALPGATVHDLLRHQAEDNLEPLLHQPLTVSSESSLFDAARVMLVNHVHRLWVVPPTSASPSETNTSGANDNKVLFEGLGVLTLTDVLRAVYFSEK